MCNQVWSILTWFGNKENEMDIDLAQQLTILVEPFAARILGPSIIVETIFYALQKRSRGRPSSERHVTGKQCHHLTCRTFTLFKVPRQMNTLWQV